MFVVGSDTGIVILKLFCMCHRTKQINKYIDVGSQRKYETEGAEEESLDCLKWRYRYEAMIYNT